MVPYLNPSRNVMQMSKREREGSPRLITALGSRGGPVVAMVPALLAVGAGVLLVLACVAAESSS